MAWKIFRMPEPRLGPEVGAAERLGSGYLVLRRWLGFIGIALPIALFLFHVQDDYEEDLRTSISAFYYSGMRDVLVGALAAIGLFLVTYKGNNWWEGLLATISGLGALGVALLPTARQCMANNPRDIWFKEFCGVPTRTVGDEQVAAPQPDYFLWYGTDAYPVAPAEGEGGFSFADLFTLEGLQSLLTVSNLHYLSAAVFLLGVAALSFWAFTWTSDTNVRTRWKKAWRNLFYRFCAIVIFLCVIAIGVDGLADRNGWWNSDGIELVFWLEAVAVWAFAAAWLIKGNFLGRANLLFPSDGPLKKAKVAKPEKAAETPAAAQAEAPEPLPAEAPAEAQPEGAPKPA